jgi:hypothetical protein
VGGVSDVLLSGAVSVLLVFYTAYSRGLSHVPKQQLQGAINSVMNGDPVIYATQLAIGIACSMVGGFVAASIAKERQLLNAGLASWLCVGLGIGSIISSHGAVSLVAQVAAVVVTPLCYLAGALVRRKTFKPAMA